MGIVYTTIKVRNPLKDKEFIEIEAKLDKGATLLVLPGDIVKEFEFPVYAYLLKSSWQLVY